MYVATRQAATRYYLTAGVALVGASVIAVSPMAPPMPDIHLPSIRSAEAQLAALANPFDAYAQVFQDTIANLQPIIATAAANPAPILSKILSNQVAAVQALLTLLPTTAAGVANAATTTGSANSTAVSSQLAATPGAVQALLTAIQSALSQVSTALTTTVPPLLQSAVGDFTSANIEGAINNLLLAGLTTVFPVTGVVAPALDVIAEPLQNVVNAINTHLGPVGAILSNPLQNVVNVINAVTNGGVLSPLSQAVVGAIGPVINAAGATGAAIDNVISASGEGPAAFLDAVVTAPATVLGGVLNGGFGPNLASLVGLPPELITVLSGGLLNQMSFPGGALELPGAIPAFQTLVQTIVNALVPPSIPAAMGVNLASLSALKAPGALPSLTAGAVSLKAPRVLTPKPAKTGATDTGSTTDQSGKPTKTGGTDSGSTTDQSGKAAKTGGTDSGSKDDQGGSHANAPSSTAGQSGRHAKASGSSAGGNGGSAHAHGSGSSAGGNGGSGGRHHAA
jgi:hypothetical protein